MRFLPYHILNGMVFNEIVKFQGMASNRTQIITFNNFLHHMIVECVPIWCNNSVVDQIQADWVFQTLRRVCIELFVTIDFERLVRKRFR
jgi:hypothetical protein